MKTIKRITLIAIGVSVFYIFFLILILSGTEEERMLTRHLLVTDESFMSTNPVYYRPVAFFFKRPGKITAADQLEYLEKKYNRVFEISRSGNVFYDVKLPEIHVSARARRLFRIRRQRLHMNQNPIRITGRKPRRSYMMRWRLPGEK